MAIFTLNIHDVNVLIKMWKYVSLKRLKYMLFIRNSNKKTCKFK